ncbi:MAG: 1-(5-phosphoribosyl)-5-[(5-phosphoribosylamino)methylideneamino]imidazole-4-carboxamide isomerase [Candidatus Bathyarchaeia archaeon]
MIPTVDIMSGEVVRLLRGDPKLAKSYMHLGDPVTLAEKWESEGAPLIHIVDLDAALGMGENTNIILRIIRSVRVPVQVGGGIRSINLARRLINSGAARIVVGSLGFRDINAFKIILEEVGSERVVVALDHLDGEIMIRGWRESTNVTLRGAAELFSTIGVKYFLVTSIQRDGAMTGPDIENLSNILDLGVNIMASGGIRSLGDIAILRDLGVYGVVVGKALYEGCFTLREALKVAQEK